MSNTAIIVDPNILSQEVPTTANAIVISSNVADLYAESTLLVQDDTLNIDVSRLWVPGMDGIEVESTSTPASVTNLQLWYMS